MAVKAMAVLVGWSLVILVLSLAWALPTSLVTHVAAEAGLLVVRVQTPDYIVTAGGVEVPGYALDTTPAAPSLPLYGLTFELPLTGDWELSFESSGSRILVEQVAIAAVPVPDLDLNGPTAPQDREVWPSSVPVFDRPDPGIYGANAFYPASPVVAGEAVVQGGRRILPVRVFPFQYNPVTSQLRYHPDLLVQVQVQSGAEGTVPATPPPGDFYEPTALPGDGLLRIHTKERGLYRLTYDELNAAGVPTGPGGANPNTFAVYYKGEQIDIEVMGATDGSFDEGDLVIFFAVPYDGGRFQDYNIYQFVYGNGIVSQRIDTRFVSTTTVPITPSVITQTLHIEYDRDYRSLYPRPSDADHFFDTQIHPNTSNPTVIRSYDLALVSPVTSEGNVLIRALIHGGVAQAALPYDQSVLLRLNEYDIGVYQWKGQVDQLITASAPAILLDSSPNRVRLVAALDQLPSLSYYWISPDWVQISYPAQAIATSDCLYVEGLVSPANGTAIAGFTTPFVLVYDVSNPGRPLRLSGVSVRADNGSYTSYWDETVANPSYVLSTEVALRAPGAIERVDRSGRPAAWANPSHAYDYVAIVGAQRVYSGTSTLGSQLATAVQPLPTHRANEGFNVALVPVQDIYDEWSYGRIDPHAIRSFLSYAYFNWATRPGYVLLVGDGHYDYNKVTTQTLPMLLPPYLAYVDPWWGEVPTDNLYVSVDSLADYLPDMAVGRLPVNNAADVIAMVDKILTYEGVASNPDGSWQQRAVYVAGDCADSAGNFHALSNQGRLQWLPTAYISDRVYYDNPNNTIVCPDGTHTNGTDTDANTLRPAVRDVYNQGAFFLQWFGHGSQATWGGVSSGIALKVRDIRDTSITNPLTSNTRFPFTTANACLTGYFVWQASPAFVAAGYWQSLAEEMVLAPDRGSIADLSPSGLHVGSALTTLQRGIHENLFEERIERAGDVVDAAKWYFFENSSSWHDVIDTMTFFGDPALKLRYSVGDLSSSALEVSNEVVPLGATLNYTLTVSTTSIFTTSHPLVVVDYPQYLVTVIAANGAVDDGDTLSWSLSDLPPDSQQVVIFTLGVDAVPAPEGFDLVVPATVSSQMAPSVDLAVQTLILTAPDAVASNLELSRAWLPPNFPVTATLVISHAGDLLAPGVQVTMTLPPDLGAPIWLSIPSLDYDPAAHRITWNGDAPAGGPTLLAFSSVISSSLTACADLELAVAVAYRNVTRPQTSLLSLVVPDVDCSGSMTVADIQQVAALWGTQAGDGLYHPRFDLNADDVIDVLDITAAAQAWQ